MEKIDILEEKVHLTSKLIRDLREKTQKMDQEIRKLVAENELLLSENKGVRRIMSELDALREERKQVRHKCERLLGKFEKLNV
ncbi:MAG: hypothetical protein A2902_03335 [Elusimicrobia bacterium RIFCSPLOWO2_01_FULL_64_13]|nr:MAG: hypothetical protein A2636_02065 [Elusimicrobia bacterium RIFCSPHIGHO2_01_FULL_64_10]OGR95775.1 MAG: hypothetical protein A2902_03335 [Elusimicrobia bacterium RIFCSPLOWO2_01_FULL_64_13]